MQTHTCWLRRHAFCICKSREIVFAVDARAPHATATKPQPNREARHTTKCARPALPYPTTTHLVVILQQDANPNHNAPYDKLRTTCAAPTHLVVILQQDANLVCRVCQCRHLLW